MDLSHKVGLGSGFQALCWRPRAHREAAKSEDRTGTKIRNGAREMGWPQWVFHSGKIYPLSWWQGSSQRHLDFGVRTSAELRFFLRERRGDPDCIIPEILLPDSSARNVLPSPAGGSLENFSKMEFWSFRILESQPLRTNEFQKFFQGMDHFLYLLPQHLAWTQAQ